MTVDRGTMPVADVTTPLVQAGPIRAEAGQAESGQAEAIRARSNQAEFKRAGLTSIIVPSRNQRHLLATLVDSLLRSLDGHRVELIIVDNGSDDEETPRWLAALPSRLADSVFERIRVVVDPSPFNYSALNNLAASFARGDVLCLLNDDIEALADHDWLGAMLALARLPDVGCVGAKLIFPDDTIQHAGIMLGLDCVAGHPYRGAPRDAAGHADYLHKVQQVSAVTGACLVLERAIFEQVGGLDERLPIAWNDVDLCLRVASAGYRNLWTPEAVLRHHESASRRRSARSRSARRRHRESIAFMRSRWGDALAHDPHLSNPPRTGGSTLAESARREPARPRWWQRSVDRLRRRRLPPE